jgi:GNAT superfamily N-acetyltransferase
VAAIGIRSLTVDDWAVWRAVRLQALTDAPDAFGSKLADWEGENDREERWRERFEHVEFNAVALADELAVGAVGGILAAERTVELISMWVAPQVRGTGVGEALIAAVIDWAARTSATTVRLAVRRGNQHAVELYERVGFGLVGPNPDDAAEDLMALHVPLRPTG